MKTIKEILMEEIVKIDTDVSIESISNFNVTQLSFILDYLNKLNEEGSINLLNINN